MSDFVLNQTKCYRQNELKKWNKAKKSKEEEQQHQQHSCDAKLCCVLNKRITKTRFTSEFYEVLYK